MNKYYIEGVIMSIVGSKVVIIGAGMVGSATAFCLTVQGIAAEVVLIDLNKEKALGEVLDLQHSIEYLDRNVRLRVGDYDECKDADVVVITASVPMTGVSSRLDMLEKNVKIVDDITAHIMASGFNGHIIVVSNPVDVLSYFVYKRSGLPKEQVIGTGTSLETARLKQIIGQLVEIDPRSVQAFAMGEHGDSMMVPWSHVTIGGKSIDEVMEDNPEWFVDVDFDSLIEQTMMAGGEVLKRKGSTQFGIASATTAIISAILRDENKILTVSTLLDGEYGLHDIYLGVPTIIGKDGVVDIGTFHLTEEEKQKFQASANIIQDNIKKIYE